MTIRYQQYIRQRYKAMLGYLGVIIVIIGLIILLPLTALLFFPNETAFWKAFFIPASVALLSGGMLWYFFIPEDAYDLTYPEGTLIVAISWLSAVFLGAVPFELIGDLTFTQAVFEAASGWTTTGLTVVDVTHAPRIILFYRSVLQWMGGAGFAIIMLSALAGPAGTGLSTAEGRESQLVPNIRRSAELVLTIYSGYTLFGIVSLYVAGMGGFDAVNHAFTSVSTGGFSTREGSIGYWKSPAIEAVIIALMLLGSTNFFTGYLLFKRKFSSLYRNSEIRLELMLSVILMPLLFIIVTRHLYPEFKAALRTTVFETISAMSTTGFSTTSYDLWGGFGGFVLIVLMLIGGGTGSTSGGIKQYRIYVLFRGLLWEFKRRILPDKAVTEPDVWHGEQRRFISDEELKHNALFLFLYLIFFVFGAMVIAAHGFSIHESLFEFASSVGTVGLSVGVTGADTPAAILWTQTIGMLLGRLEFFAVIVGVLKLFSDLRPIILQR